MAVPFVLAAVGIGSVTSLITGLAIDKATGHKTSESEMIGYALTGAIPGVGYAKGGLQFASRAYKSQKVLKYYKPFVGQTMRLPSRLPGTYSLSGVIRYGSMSEASLNMAAWTIGGLRPAVGAFGYEMMINHMLDQVYPEVSAAEQTSRGRGNSLTRVPKTPRQPQTKRSAGKRTFPPRPSKGGNENGRARRKLTYCNLHKKYDYCEYYKRN